MLRIAPSTGGPGAAPAAPRVAAAAATGHIARDFDDPYLELVRLLHEASEIEHALLVQYLYAAYSVKPAYSLIKGFEFPSTSDLLGVAIQEMQHLEQVNRMLVAVGAAPNLVRQDFPYETDIYPFEFNLEPLSRASLARYIYTEASAEALDPTRPENADPATQRFLSDLDDELGGVTPNHLGSLYDAIIALTTEVARLGLPDLGDLSTWLPKLQFIKSQGETGHFTFFRHVFTGDHPGLAARPDAWSLDPSDPDYPSFDLGRNPSAFLGHPQQIPDAEHRRTAWLSDLHYWLVLGLLDLGYRGGVTAASGLAKRHMSDALGPLGAHLATLRVGLPFDPLSMGYAPGPDLAGSIRILRRIAEQARAVTGELDASLPATYPRQMVTQTLAVLDTLVPGSTPVGGGGPGPGGSGGTPSEGAAGDFWYELDDRFLFNRPPEVNAALGAIQGPHFILSRFDARVQAGEFPEGFRQDVAPLAGGLTTMSTLQLEVVDKHLGTAADLQAAFEHFGCGDLFDDRRPPGNKVHMMDSSGPDNPPIGYHRWHAINRAMTLLDIDADRWRAIDRVLGLAWAVHAEVQPLQDTANQALPEARMDALRAHWLNLTDDELDAAFSVFPFPDPVP